MPTVVRFHNCQIKRCKLVRSGYMRGDGEFIVENEDYQIGPCNAPLFDEKEQLSGICKSCASGWTHENNFPVDPIPQIAVRP